MFLLNTKLKTDKYSAWWKNLTRLRLIMMASCLVLSALFGNISNVLASPTRLFIQEEARTAPSRAIFLDLYNTTGEWTTEAESQLRISTSLGELVASKNELGLKRALWKNVIAYNFLNMNTSANQTNIRIGLAYRYITRNFLVNLNPEYQRANGTSFVNINGAFFLPIKTSRTLGALQVGAEYLALGDKAKRNGVALGFRWLPRKMLTIDIIIMGDGGTASESTFKTPAALRINLRI